MRKYFRLIILGFMACASTIAADNYTWGNVVFEGGGFVDGIIPSHTQAGLVYARTDVGGAYRFDSVSGKWIPLMDWVSEQNLGLLGTEAIALDPSDPAKLYILCGTSYFSKGKTMILRSSDYGATFDTVNVTAQFPAHGNGRGRQAGEKLAVDPKNGAILYCGTRISGLFRSTDSGKTWTLVAGTKTLSGSNITNDIGISYVVFDTTSGTANGGTKSIYVGVGSSSGSLYKSIDGGVSFTAVSGAPAQMAMRAVLVNGNLYGTYSLGEGPDKQSGGSVWKYAIGAGTWTNITPKTDSGFAYASGHEGYGYAFGGITVDPQNSSRFILSTEASYGGNNAWVDGKGNAGDIFFLSENGGTSWKILNPWGAATPTVSPNGNNWISGGNIHWASTIEFDPFNNKKVWVGSGNGIFRTDDVTAAVPLWLFQSRGIEETVPMDIVSVPGGPLVTAIMDYDGATYDDILTSTPAHPHPIGSDNSLGYAALVGGFLRSGRVTDYSVSPSVTYDVLYHSTDSGRTWTPTDTSSLPGSAGSLAMSADGRVYLLRPSNLHNGKNASSSIFYRSADAGKTWTAVTSLNTQNGRMVADQVNPAKFYIMPEGYIGDFYTSSDTGKTFVKISTIKNPNYNYSPASSGMLRTSPSSDGDLWICLDEEQIWNKSGYSANGLAHSIDGGATWTYINTMDGCLSIGLGKAAPGASYYTLYMWGGANGGARGIYSSIDKGQTWTRINDDQHQYGGPANGKFVMGDLNTYGRVYMSSAGRGIVYGNIGTLVAPIQNHITVQQRVVVNIQQQGRSLFVQSQGLHNAHLEMFDLKGSLLQNTSLHEGVQMVSLSTMPHGFFVARIVAAEGIVTTKRITL